MSNTAKLGLSVVPASMANLLSLWCLVSLCHDKAVWEVWSLWEHVWTHICKSIKFKNAISLWSYAFFPVTQFFIMFFLDYNCQVWKKGEFRKINRSRYWTKLFSTKWRHAGHVIAVQQRKVWVSYCPTVTRIYSAIRSAYPVENTGFKILWSDAHWQTTGLTLSSYWS